MNITTQLTGTEKQIAYGEALRTRMIKDVNEYFDSMRASAAKTNPAQSPLVEQFSEYLETELSKITDAVWWIENKPVVSEFIRPFHRAFLEKLTQNLPQQVQ